MTRVWCRYSVRMLIGTLAVVAMSVVPAGAGTPGGPFSPAQVVTPAVDAASPLEVFTPYAQRMTIPVDYSTLDIILRSIVIDFGPSDRVSMRLPPKTASRLKLGHSGASGLEGNRIFFSRFSSATVKALTRYRQDLEKLGNEVDFARLSRDQQLAYWYNLHNVAVIEQVALHYPVKYPENIHPDESRLKLHDAKFLSVKGVKLSLRDIRTKIVYAHWKDPVVIYGFFLGEVGGPSIVPQAYTGERVRELLAANAREFINSLRGVRQFGDRVYVSGIYRQAKVFFSDWDKDLRSHLQGYAQATVQGQLDNDYPLVIQKHFRIVADLYGGYVTGVGGVGDAYKNGTRIAGLGFPPHVQALLQNLAKKDRRLKRRERNRFREKIVIVGEDRDAGDAPTPQDSKTGKEQ